MSNNIVDLRLLRYFIVVAQTEHLGRASKLLHVSQSPLSRQVRQLEEETGLQLFLREKQRLRLTNEGKWMLARASRVLEQARELTLDAQRLARGETGRLRIGFVKMAMWTQILPSALRRFRASHAGVLVELESASSRTQLRALRRGRIDVAFVHERPDDETITSIRLHEAPLRIAFPKDHPLAARRRLSPRDLDGADFVALRPGGNDEGHARLLAACERMGFVPKIRYAVRDQESARGLVAAGMGIAFVPEEEGVEPRGIVTVRPAWLKLSRTLFAAFRTCDDSATTRALIACLARAHAHPSPMRARAIVNSAKAPRQV